MEGKSEAFWCLRQYIHLVQSLTVIGGNSLLLSSSHWPCNSLCSRQRITPHFLFNSSGAQFFMLFVPYTIYSINLQTELSVQNFYMKHVHTKTCILKLNLKTWDTTILEWIKTWILQTRADSTAKIIAFLNFLLSFKKHSLLSGPCQCKKNYSNSCRAECVSTNRESGSKQQCYKTSPTLSCARRNTEKRTA